MKIPFLSKQPKHFFKPEEEDQLIAAIREAEAKSSGEIRVHVEPKFKGEDAFARALVCFKELEMQKTKQQNGVLFYLAYEQHKFAIVADQGINAVVPADFWDEIRDNLHTAFQKKQFLEGLKAAILQTGEQLKAHFPHAGDDDQNELPDEISKA